MNHRPYSSTSRRTGTHRQLEVELTREPPLVRHIALCRLLHAAGYQRLTASDLETLADRIAARDSTGALVGWLIKRLGALREAEAAGDTRAWLLRREAASGLLEHGRRFVWGKAPCNCERGTYR